MASNVERRIVERGFVEPIPVTLRATERSRGLLGGVRAVKVSEPGFIVDLSVAGAGIVTREIAGLMVRSVVEVSHEGHSATAVVRRVVRRDDGRAMYGVDFSTMDPAMRELLYSLIEARRPGDVEQRWLRSH